MMHASSCTKVAANCQQATGEDAGVHVGFAHADSDPRMARLLRTDAIRGMPAAVC
jgi:hypothetical protein